MTERRCFPFLRKGEGTARYGKVQRNMQRGSTTSRPTTADSGLPRSQSLPSCSNEPAEAVTAPPSASPTDSFPVFSSPSEQGAPSREKSPSKPNARSSSPEFNGERNLERFEQLAPGLVAHAEALIREVSSTRSPQMSNERSSSTYPESTAFGGSSHSRTLKVGANRFYDIGSSTNAESETEREDLMAENTPLRRPPTVGSSENESVTVVDEPIAHFHETPLPNRATSTPLESSKGQTLKAFDSFLNYSFPNGSVPVRPKARTPFGPLFTPTPKEKKITRFASCKPLDPIPEQPPFRQGIEQEQKTALELASQLQALIFSLDCGKDTLRRRTDAVLAQNDRKWQTREQNLRHELNRATDTRLELEHKIADQAMEIQTLRARNEELERRYGQLRSAQANDRSTALRLRAQKLEQEIGSLKSLRIDETTEFKNKIAELQQRLELQELRHSKALANALAAAENAATEALPKRRQRPPLRDHNSGRVPQLQPFAETRELTPVKLFTGDKTVQPVAVAPLKTTNPSSTRNVSWRSPLAMNIPANASPI